MAAARRVRRGRSSVLRRCLLLLQQRAAAAADQLLHYMHKFTLPHTPAASYSTPPTVASHGAGGGATTTQHAGAVLTAAGKRKDGLPRRLPQLHRRLWRLRWLAEPRQQLRAGALRLGDPPLAGVGVGGCGAAAAQHSV